jgi:hypothetical protein
MKRCIFMIAAVLALGATWAQAQSTNIVIIDENGNGTLNGDPLLWSVGQDSGPGGLSNALIYQFPTTLGNWTVGDLLLQEPSGSGGGSDLIRFNPDNTLVFYSDMDGAILDIADIGIPPDRYPNNLTRTELVNGDGSDGIFYVPTEGSNPGFLTGLQVEYHIISEVPEPSTFVLMAMGILGLLAVGWRKSRQ